MAEEEVDGVSGRGWQDHVIYLELCKVWETIGLNYNDIKDILRWSRDYPVNIAFLDSGVKATHKAFTYTKLLHTRDKSYVVETSCKVIHDKSFVDGNTSGRFDWNGHGTFCAGVAAGFPISSPKPIQVSTVLEAATDLCTLLNVTDQEQVKKVGNMVQTLSGNPSERLPYFIGVAPFANVVSFKVFKDKETKIENEVAAALQEVFTYNHDPNLDEKKRVHIVCIPLAVHYNDKIRQAMYDLLNDDIIVVAAACNKGQTSDYCNGNIWFPARFGNVIAVGSHDNLGQPSRFSSVGREVDFLAPGEEIWGPSRDGEENNIFKKDEGTSMSAAIVSGIVALVLAFFHKVIGPDARAKISNNPIMKEILGKMATKEGQHDKVQGYGSLKPIKFFRNNREYLNKLIKEIIDDWDSNVIDGNVCLSHFILSETALAMHSFKYEEEIKKLDIKSVNVEHLKDTKKFPCNYDENEDASEIVGPGPGTELLMKSTSNALEYLASRQFSHHVEIIDLTMPDLPLTDAQSINLLGRSRKLLLCDNVMPIIEKSRVEVIEQLIFPDKHYICMKDLCTFMSKLCNSVLSGLKIVVMPFGTPLGVLYRIAKILSIPDIQEPVFIFASYLIDVCEQCDKSDNPILTNLRNNPEQVTCNSKNDRIEGITDRVRVIATWTTKYKPNTSSLRVWKVGSSEFQNVLNVARNELLKKPEESQHLNNVELLDCVPVHVHVDVQAQCLDVQAQGLPDPGPLTLNPSISIPEPLKVTVAILGDAINVHQSEIQNLIQPDKHIKCFIVPSEGTVEKGRYLHVGTLCASIIAGKSKDIEPSVDLVYATVINAKVHTKLEWVISALEWIDKFGHIDIVVIPFGFTKFNLKLYKIINRLSKKMVVVCAAGNCRSASLRPKICYPARYGDVICVGSHSASSQVSPFSPQGREMDLLAQGDAPYQNFFVDSKKIHESYFPIIIPKTYSMSGTCVAVACAARVIVQIVAYALQCGKERKTITNNTVMRELLKHHTRNFSHDPHNGHGLLNNLSEYKKFKKPLEAYFEDFDLILGEILKIDVEQYIHGDL